MTQDTGEDWVKRGERIISAYINATEAPMSQQIWRPSAQCATESNGSTKASVVPAPRHRTWRAVVAVAALICMLAIGSLWAYRSVGAWKSYSTTPRHAASVRLEEGSMLTLDPDSIADVRFSDDSREVRLQSGKATFTVLHDPARPFRVAVAFGTVEAIGTMFSVSVQESRALVEVQEGKVRVAGRTPHNTSIDLAAGERASILADGSIQFVSRGGLMDGVPLSDIVASINAKHRHPNIRVEGSACNRQMGGKWHFEDPEQLVRALTGMAKFTVTRVGDDEVVIRERDDPSQPGVSSCVVGTGTSEAPP